MKNEGKPGKRDKVLTTLVGVLRHPEQAVEIWYAPREIVRFHQSLEAEKRKLMRVEKELEKCQEDFNVKLEGTMYYHSAYENERNLTKDLETKLQAVEGRHEAELRAYRTKIGRVERRSDIARQKHKEYRLKHIRLRPD